MGDATKDDVLGPLERRVMTHLWGVGPSTVTEARGALNSSAAAPLAYTTVMTVLARLSEKGYLSRTKVGRGFRYSAVVDEASVSALAARRELRRFVKRYGEAPVAAFAADLAGADPRLVQRLREFAEPEDDANNA